MPTEYFLIRYTRVLMGQIDLASATLPANTEEKYIDILTRRYIFDKGLNFAHGTGHGIGSYLKVHEGPTYLGMRDRDYPSKLKPNMFFSDEPGYYKSGEFGIRLESILRVVPMENSNEDNAYGKIID